MTITEQTRSSILRKLDSALRGKEPIVTEPKPPSTETLSETARQHIAGIEAMQKEVFQLRADNTEFFRKNSILATENGQLRQLLADTQSRMEWYMRFSTELVTAYENASDILSRIGAKARQGAYRHTGTVTTIEETPPAEPLDKDQELTGAGKPDDGQPIPGFLTRERKDD